MALSLSTGLRTMMLGTAPLKTAFAHGVIQIFSGPQPANADAAVRGNLLGVVSVSAGAWTAGTTTNGITFDAATAGGISKAAAEAWQIGDGSGVAGASGAGTAGWFRLLGNPSDGGAGSNTANARLDGSVATSGADLNLPNIDFVIGTPVTIDVFSLTLPQA